MAQIRRCALAAFRPSRWLHRRTAAPRRDPVEGAWLGTCGTDKEHIDVGFEFYRDHRRQAALQLTEPILNTFGFDDPGEVRREGDRVIVDNLYVDLKLKGDTLVGHYPGPRSPATLHRVDALPTEAPVPDLPTGPAPLWQTRLDGQAYAAPIVADGVAYIGTTGGVFDAVDTKDGKIAWAFAPGAPIFGAAAVDGDAVYFASDNGYLYKLDRASGKERWHYIDRRRRRAARDAASDDRRLGLASRATARRRWRRLYRRGRRRLRRGRCGDRPRKWRFASRARIRTGAAIDGDRVVFGSADHFVYSLDRETGDERWRYDTGADVDATPVVARRPRPRSAIAATGFMRSPPIPGSSLETLLLGLVGRIDAGRARRRDLHRRIGPAPRQRDRSEGWPRALAHRCLRLDLGHAARDATIASTRARPAARRTCSATSRASTRSIARPASC